MIMVYIYPRPPPYNMGGLPIPKACIRFRPCGTGLRETELQGKTYISISQLNTYQLWHIVEDQEVVVVVVVDVVNVFVRTMYQEVV